MSVYSNSSNKNMMFFDGSHNMEAPSTSDMRSTSSPAVPNNNSKFMQSRPPPSENPTPEIKSGSSSLNSAA